MIDNKSIHNNAGTALHCSHRGHYRSEVIRVTARPAKHSEPPKLGASFPSNKRLFFACFKHCWQIWRVKQKLHTVSCSRIKPSHQIRLAYLVIKFRCISHLNGALALLNAFP